MNPEFFISPVFFVLLGLTVALLTAFVCWLMSDGPNTRRAGMIDLTGAKPRGMVWDWPCAPNVTGYLDGEIYTLRERMLAEAPAPLLAEIADAMAANVSEARSVIVREPDRRQWFGV